MGLSKSYLEYINESVSAAFTDISGRRMLELGSQRIKDGCVPEKTGKRYFERMGFEHTSVDLNGLDRSLKLDLSKPEQFTKWHNYFDIVTNSGTSEHVEPKAAQYECFKIIHNCLRAGGIAVHLVPDVNELKARKAWEGHCRNYYSFDFFNMLAENNKYNILSVKIINGLVCCCLQKAKDIPFMSDREKFLSYIIRKKEGALYPGINAGWTLVFWTLFVKIGRKLIAFIAQGEKNAYIGKRKN